MKKYYELLNEANKIVYNDNNLKNIFKDFLPFRGVLFNDTQKKIELNSLRKSICAQTYISEEHDRFNSIINDLLFYNLEGENGNKLKTMYGITIYQHLRLATSLHPNLENIINHLTTISNNVCLVGGCIRDICTGKTPKDFDFVVDVSYEKLEEYFGAFGSNITIKTTGKQFNIFNVIYPDGETFEIALFRKDGTYSDGRRPDSVEIGDIFTDSERRDFSVNSLYYSLNKDLLLDPTGNGVDDLYTRTLRFNGNAHLRINEDYLRVFSAYRFISKGFTPENKTLNAIRSNFDVAIKVTASERIKNEIERVVGL